MSGKTLFSKILFLQDFPTLIGSAFAFVAKLEFSVKLTSATFLSPKRTWELSKNIKNIYGVKMKREVGCKEKWTSSFWQVTHNLVYNISGKIYFFSSKSKKFYFWSLGGGRERDNQSKLVQITTLHLSFTSSYFINIFQAIFQQLLCVGVFLCFHLLLLHQTILEQSQPLFGLCFHFLLLH